MDSWVIVYTTTFSQEIYPAQSLLQAGGIETFIKDEFSAQVGYPLALGGVKLMVPAGDAARAHALLVEGGYIEE